MLEDVHKHLHCKKTAAQGSNKTRWTSALCEKIAAGIMNPKLTLSTQHHVNLLHMILLLCLFSTVNTWSKTYTDQIDPPVFMVYNSTFQCHYVPKLYSHGHMNQCEVLYHPTGMKSTHHGLLATTTGFWPPSNEDMDALRKFVHTFNLPETMLAFKATSDTLKQWVRKNSQITEVHNLASLVSTGKVLVFLVPALQSVMSKQELFELEEQLTKECVEDKSKTMGEVVAKAGWGPKFSTILDMGYLNSIWLG
ncbi:hypothetical protein FRC10_006844 [Ceratobasidium sp. 414]|nr:hypothetical protein FRC10_006844 [Ceratobasidium sp. 414]